MGESRPHLEVRVKGKSREEKLFAPSVRNGERDILPWESRIVPKTCQGFRTDCRSCRKSRFKPRLRSKKCRPRGVAGTVGVWLAATGTTSRFKGSWPNAILRKRVWKHISKPLFELKCCTRVATGIDFNDRGLRKQSLRVSVDIVTSRTSWCWVNRDFKPCTLTNGWCGSNLEPHQHSEQDITNVPDNCSSVNSERREFVRFREREERDEIANAWWIQKIGGVWRIAKKFHQVRPR